MAGLFASNSQENLIKSYPIVLEQICFCLVSFKTSEEKKSTLSDTNSRMATLSATHLFSTLKFQFVRTISPSDFFVLFLN